MSAGVGGSATDAHAWQAITATPLGGLDETGPVVRALITQLMFRYRTSLPDDPSATIEASGWAGDAEVGWQWVAGDNRLALLAGGAARQYDLSPNDPGSTLEGFHWSASLSAQAGLEVPSAPAWALLPEVTWRPQIGEVWAQARLGRDQGDGLRLGPEAAVSRGDDYLFVRVGAFATGYKLTFASTDIFVGGAAGASFDEGFSPSPYGGIWLGIKF